ncbi:MAG: MSMEG_4193 family putative phosphomutase [Acidimicrobiales bacterium]
MAPRRKPTPPTMILFVRHGQTGTTGKVLPGRAPGLHLADKGRAQAQVVAERIGTLKTVDAVYSSPLERARETAAPIAAARGLRVRVDRGLLECDFGAWTGANLKDLMKKPEWGSVQRYPSGFRFPGGESFVEMAARMCSTAVKLKDRHPGGVIVAVSHADPIKAVIADALGTHLDLFQRIVVSTCSVTGILYGGGGPAVLTVNNTGDLTALAPS